MKRINNFIFKNIEKIIIAFFLLQPFFDLMTSLTVRSFNFYISFGMIIRGAFLLVLVYYLIFLSEFKHKKRFIIGFSLIVLYIIIFLVNIYISKDSFALFTEAKYIFKSFYFPVSLLFLYYIVINKPDMTIKKQELFLILATYIFLILIPYIFNLGYESYGGEKVGTNGWFVAANEIGAIIAILSPIFVFSIIKLKNKILALIIIILFAIFSMLLGTKVPFLGVIITLLVAMSYFLHKYIVTKNKNNLKIIFPTIIFSIIMIMIILPYTNMGKNLNYHFKLVNINGFSDLLKNDEKTEKGKINIILSSRDVYLKNTREKFIKSPINVKLLGMGFIEDYGLKTQNIESIEMDYPDIFYRFGIIGCLVYFFFPTILGYKCLRKFVYKPRIILKSSVIVTLVTSIFLALSISLFAGHVLTAPAVSIYLTCLLIMFYIKIDKIKSNFVKKTRNRIWIDITNSPHAILYNPIIKKMKELNYDIVVTARDYAQTIGLLDMFKIEYTLIGDHKGKSKIKKIWGLFERSIQLYWFARNKDFDASLSMSSQTAMIASKMLDIPHMTLYDYEYTAGHHIDFRLSKQILTPKGVEEKTLKKYGAKMENVIFYPGLKEQFYIYYYMEEYNNKYKDQNPIKKQFNIPQDKVLIVVRPEATVAHYQSNENNLCFELVEYLSKHKSKPYIIVLPRIKSQKEEYIAKKYENVIIPNEVINGIELVASSDIVIGAGGTVNREAAAIGVPVYTIYQGGLMGAVDRMLIRTGKMVRIESTDDFNKIKIERKSSIPKPIDKNFEMLYINLVDKLIKSKEEEH